VLAGPAADPVATVTEAPDLPTEAREVGPTNQMGGPPLAHQEGRAARTTAPSPVTTMVNRVKDVSGGAADRADETWLREAARHVQLRAPDRIRIGQPTSSSGCRPRGARYPLLSRIVA
jgi:hypothetical protein